MTSDIKPEVEYCLN